MSKTATYRNELAQAQNWDIYLLEHSNLPGPRANLELVQAAADAGDETRFRHWLDFDPERAPANSREEFLPVCGAVGLGKLLADGQAGVLGDLRQLAADPRWRVREGVAMALQRWGDRDMPALLVAMQEWAQAGPFEQRAAVAGLCEPRLLTVPAHAHQVLSILDRITARLSTAADRKGEGFRALRKALAYGWSVAAAALPETGKGSMEKWFTSADRDVRWVMRQNLQKDRLLRMDAGWVAQWRDRV